LFHFYSSSPVTLSFHTKESRGTPTGQSTIKVTNQSRRHTPKFLFLTFPIENCEIILSTHTHTHELNKRASCAGGREKAGQILHSVANGSPPLQHLPSSCVALALRRGDGHCKLVTRFGVIRRV